MSLFDEAVRASRLSELLAPYAMTRLLVRGGANPQKLTPETLREALPEIEEGLAVYLPREEIAAAIDELRALAAA